MCDVSHGHSAYLFSKQCTPHAAGFLRSAVTDQETACWHGPMNWNYGSPDYVRAVTRAWGQELTVECRTTVGRVQWPHGQPGTASRWCKHCKSIRNGDSAGFNGVALQKPCRQGGTAARSACIQMGPRADVAGV